MKKYILLTLLLCFQAKAFFLNTNVGARFKNPNVKVYITSNSTCTNAGISKEELLDLAVSGAKKYWNSVPTSTLIIERGGILSSSDSKFLSAKLCASDSQTTCPAATSVPKVTDIVIACNNNTVDNFTSSEIIALTVPNHLSGNYIEGSVILINDSNTSTFANLSLGEIEDIMAHEIGHAVGLGHTDKEEALMYYKFNKDMRNLSQDDIDGVSYLYPNQLDGCKSVFGLSTIDNDKSSSLPPSFFYMLVGLFIGLILPKIWINFTQKHQ